LVLWHVFLSSRSDRRLPLTSRYPDWIIPGDLLEWRLGEILQRAWDAGFGLEVRRWG
jgi:hypothetical protein